MNDTGGGTGDSASFTPSYVVDALDMVKFPGRQFSSDATLTAALKTATLSDLGMARIAQCIHIWGLARALEVDVANQGALVQLSRFHLKSVNTVVLDRLLIAHIKTLARNQQANNKVLESAKAKLQRNEFPLELIADSLNPQFAGQTLQFFSDDADKAARLPVILSAFQW